MLFPKTKAKTKRMRHPASILHDKNSRTCYLCVTLHDNWNEHRILDEHHIFGGPNRKNSEEYALTRVQARQQKAIEMLHKFGYDDAKLELATMQLEFEMLKQDNQAEDTTDDSFLEAMNATAQNVWGDEDV